MANLLPKKERKRFELEYNFRLLTVILLFSISTLIFGIILLLPSYFISQSKEKSIERQSELLQKIIVLREKDKSVESLLTTKQKINQLSAQNQIHQTEVIQTIIRNISEDIVVKAFYYIHGINSKGEIRITGIADSRKALLFFSDKLKKENLFDSVDFPVSSLAQDLDISFSITLSGDF